MPKLVEKHFTLFLKRILLRHPRRGKKGRKLTLSIINLDVFLTLVYRFVSLKSLFTNSISIFSVGNDNRKKQKKRRKKLGGCSSKTKHHLYDFNVKSKYRF